MGFHPDHSISERVIFPVSKNESRGIEDARFVQFFDDNGEVVYSGGSIIHNNELVIPYAMSDINSGIAVVGVSELLNAMRIEN